MKVLLTGSTGLVGTALVNELARDGHTVCRLIRPLSTVVGGAHVAIPQEKSDRFDVEWNPVSCCARAGLIRRELWLAG